MERKREGAVEKKGKEKDGVREEKHIQPKPQHQQCTAKRRVSQRDNGAGGAAVGFPQLKTIGGGMALAGVDGTPFTRFLAVLHSHQPGPDADQPR